MDPHLCGEPGALGVNLCCRVSSHPGWPLLPLPLKVPVTWQELVDDSDRIDYSLEETKKEFSETTRKQVNRRGGGIL